MADYLRKIVELSFGSSPEEMLKASLETCVELSGATGGSILGEEGPHLQFLFSDVLELIGVQVPFDSIAGVTVERNKVIYTYAPADKRHFTGVDDKIRRVTKYLLSIPIRSIHRAPGADRTARNAGALQLLFNENILLNTPVDKGAQEFDIERFESSELFTDRLKGVFWLLPIVAFGMEVMRLRQTSYQVIHELKNKLISGQSWLSYLREDIRRKDGVIFDDETIKQDFELSETAIKEGANLAKNYLQFTRLYSPNFEPANVNDVLSETAASVKALAAELNAKDFSVVLKLDPAVGNRNLDAGQLKMAFFNLCKNGVEALVERKVAKPTITIASAHGDNAVTVTIGDNGPGMPPEIANNLFTAFKTKKEGGTGLGLTITKKIIDVHGGSIKCDTGPAGTLFTIMI